MQLTQESSVFLYIARPKNPHYIHYRAYDDIADIIGASLKEIGLNVLRIEHLFQFYEKSNRDDRCIILGPHLLESDDFLDDRVILYNFEQISPQSPWVNENFLYRMNRYTSWDYNKNNIAKLSEFGCQVNAFVPLVSSHPSLHKIHSPEKLAVEYDVLFIGSMNDRREHVLKEIQSLGLKVKHLFGVYGEARNDYIKHSRVSVNIHYYESQIFEVARVFPWLSAGAAVVSETSVDNPPIVQHCLAWSPYENIAQTVYDLYHDHKRRRGLIEQTRVFAQEKLQADLLREKLGLFEKNLSIY